MKIGLFTELYPPSIGGQEVRFQQFAHALQSRGHDVSVFTIDHRGNLPSSEQEDGVAIFRYPSDPDYLRPDRKIRRSPKTILTYSLWCRKAVRRHCLDLKIYNQWPLLHIPFAAFTQGITVIDWCEIRSGLLWSALQSMLPLLGQVNIAVSNNVTKAIRGRSRHVTFCVPSGLRLSEYKRLPKHARSGILYVGRLSHHKNLPLLIAAFESLRQQGYGGRLTIAGSGPEAEHIFTLCASSPERNNIDFLGHVTDEAKLTLLSRAEFLLITSQREGFPRVAAEAIASGTPIITTNYTDNGTVSIVNEYRCGSVAAPDPQAIANAVLRSLPNWEHLSTTAIQNSKSLDWENLVAQFESVIEGIRS